MKARLAVPTAILFVIVAFLAVSRIRSFIQIFFEHAGITISQDEIAAKYAESTPDARQQVVPAIIHQVFHDWSHSHNETIPEDWETLRKGCIDLNPDWEYKLWTETSSREFIKANYAWFLKTYDGYPFPVQRVDTIRYFALLHFGGIYLDLDNGCLKSLEALRSYPAFTTDGGRGALSNNILGGTPNHPFWKLMTDSLIPYSWNYLFPYVTISYASGQWYETEVWETYHRKLSAAGKDKVAAKPAAQENRLYRIMMDDRPGTDPWIYFTQERGGTWVNWDNRMFLWVGEHLAFLGVGAAALTGSFVALNFWWYARARKRSKSKEQYSLLKEQYD